MTDVATAYSVPAKSDVTFYFTLKPTGADQQWEFKDKDSGEALDTIHLVFEGVKSGGTANSGKATLMVELLDTELVFADKQTTADKKYDGIETYNNVNDGLGAIQKVKKMNGSSQFLEIELKANKTESNGFSFKWAGQDAGGNLILSADPKADIEPQ